MSRRRISKIIIAPALLTAVGASGIVTDSLGFQMTLQVQAGCSGGGGYC